MAFFEALFSNLFWAFAAVAGVLGLFVLAAALIPVWICKLLPQTDLKKKYNTQWALVTGASTGIGRALVEQIAKQGLNVVLVALENDDLRKAHAELNARYPKQQFRAIGVDLSSGDYLSVIRESTDDIDIGAVFNNAGYLLIGPFNSFDMERSVKNIECNMLSHVKIGHHFYTKMAANKRKGTICFTSSSVAYFPSVYAAAYGGAKAFLIEFAQSLAIEGAHRGIDVMAVCPQYTRTNLYATTPKISSIDFFAAFGSDPMDTADQILRSVGRVVIRDQGIVSIFFHLVSHIIEPNWIVPLISVFSRFSSDFKKFN